MNRILQLNILFFLITIKTFGQFQYDETNQVIPFSYIYSDVRSSKKENKINTLNLPSYNMFLGQSIMIFVLNQETMDLV